MFPKLDLEALNTPERRARGLVFVLPGIEGRSRWNRNIIRGLAAANIPYAIELFDWTTGWRPLALFHLRSRKLQERSSYLLAEKIVAYRTEFPDAPLYLIGHSGGGAMTLLTLGRLPAGVTATGGILFGPAVSPWFDPLPALQHTSRGVWNFSSWGDCLFLGIGTTAFGSVDGWHFPSAGMTGFSRQIHDRLDAASVPLLRECPYQSRYFPCWNFAGHFGYTAPQFVQQFVAPLLQPLAPTDSAVNAS